MKIILSLLPLLFGPILASTVYADSELWFNPVTKKLEPIVIEQGKKPRAGKKTEQWFNPVTKQFEEVLVENRPDASNIQETPDFSDNGLPPSSANDWLPVSTKNDSPEWKTYKNKKTGQEVSFNPRRSYLWKNPTTGKYEPIVREAPVVSSNPGTEGQRAGGTALGTLGSARKPGGSLYSTQTPSTKQNITGPHHGAQ